MTSGAQPSRKLLIAAGALTQVIGTACLVLALASLPVAHDLRTGMGGVFASIVAALAAIVCGTLVWRGRLVPLALAAGLDVGFGIGLPRGGSAIGAIVRMLPAEDVSTAETLIVVAAIIMFAAAALCIIAVPSALKLRQWARAELAKDDPTASREFPLGTDPAAQPLDEVAPTKERPRLERPSAGNTLRGFGTVKLMPTQVIRVDGPGRGKPIVIVGVSVTLIAIGIIVITAATGGSDTSVSAAPGSGSAVAVADARVGSASSTTALVEDAAVADAAPLGESIDEFVVRFHAALAKATAADLALLFDANAFAFGVEAHDLAEG
ncbi:MAG TPA: hypothetical protein VFV99_33865, partial [Kofleriaceae bacterium]|nr:hypothetical protein [Kofleriaceae bacterium]